MNQDPVGAIELSFTPMNPDSEDERGFVFRSWLKGYRGSKDNRGLDSRSYYAVQHRIIEKIVCSDNVIICRDASEPEYLLAWLASEAVDAQYVLHGSYVRSSCRNERIFTRMLQHDLSRRACDPVLYVYTHRGNRWMEDVLQRWGFQHVQGVFR